MTSKYNSNLAFVDLLFNLMLGFAFLFTVAFLLINDPTEEEVVEAKAEYMVVMSWDGDKDVDMDLWVQSPEGLVGFRDPNIGFVNLDRDDLVHRSDKIKAGSDEERIVFINREIINIRGFQSGEYIVNGHLFFDHEPKGKEQVDVEVEVIKLNPFEEIYTGKKRFTYRGQEQTFVRFTMMPNGRYMNVHELPKNLVMGGMTTPPTVSMNSGPSRYPNNSNRNSSGSKSGRRSHPGDN